MVKYHYVWNEMSSDANKGVEWKKVWHKKGPNDTDETGNRGAPE